MSRSLGHKALNKKLYGKFTEEGIGRQMFADGKPCPPDCGDKGKEHARARGWKRAAAEARQPKNRKKAP